MEDNYENNENYPSIIEEHHTEESEKKSETSNRESDFG